MSQPNPTFQRRSSFLPSLPNHPLHPLQSSLFQLNSTFLPSSSQSSPIHLLATSPSTNNIVNEIKSTNQSLNSLSLTAKFATAGGGGILGWWVVHPFNTLAVRMNLLGASLPAGEKLPSFYTFAKDGIQKNGIKSLYDGIGAGTIRQIFYATSRFGLFEVIRDQMAGDGPVTTPMRLSAGLVSGGMAAVIACPAEVTLVRMSNDMALPIAERRNYKSFADSAMRTFTEEGE